MKNVFFMLLFPIVSVTAQTAPDSIKKRVGKVITNKFPTTRFLDIQYEQFSESDYDSEINGKEYEKGTITSQQRFKAAVNVPILKKDKWVLSGSLRYKYESFDFDNVEYTALETPGITHRNKEDFHFFATSANFTYFSQLFGKPFIYNASIVAEGSDKGYERINGLLIGSLVMTRSKTTLLTLGLLVTTNNTAPFPVLPTLSYEYKFQGSPWVFDAVVPRYVYFRRPLLENGRLSLGAMFDNELFYMYPDQQGYNGVYSYSRNEVKTGFMYEYHMSSSLIATVRGGVATIFSGQLRERGDKDEIIKTTQDMNGYFNIGFSYNPF